MLLEIYRQFIAKNSMKFDDAQAACMQILDQVAKKTWKIPFFSRKNQHGVYIYGSVGTGKTTIMDLYFRNAKFSRKTRIHSAELMRDMQNLITRGKELGWRDPMGYVIQNFRHFSLICIDEFEILDVVTSVLIRRFMAKMLDFGCIFVLTSNTHPENLYKDGLQREKFMILIDIFLRKFKIFCLDFGIDYRKNLDYMQKVQHIATKVDADFALFDVLLPKIAPGQEISDKIIQVHSRKILVPSIKFDIAILDFEVFCDGYFAHEDYNAIVAHFSRFVITKIPHPSRENLQSWRRFIWLIDAIYNSQKPFFASAYFTEEAAENSDIIAKIPEIRRAISRLFEVK